MFPFFFLIVLCVCVFFDFFLQHLTRKKILCLFFKPQVMAVIGDQFDVGSEICGIVLSIRGAEDILSIWNQSAHEGRINLKIRDTMKRILSLPADTIMEYKTHNDALKDNTSFRNTDVFR